MKYLFLLLFLLLFLFSISCEKRNQSNQIEASFIYNDYEKNYDSNNAVIFYRVSLSSKDRAFMISIPVKNLIQSFFDSRKDIPFQGKIRAEVLFDQKNRVDSFKIIEMNDKEMNLEVQAKDIN